MDSFTNPYSEVTDNSGLETLESANEIIEGIVESTADLFAPLALGGAIVAGETAIEDGYKHAQTRSKTKEMWNTSTPAKRDRENDTAPKAPSKSRSTKTPNVRRRPIPFNINNVTVNKYTRRRNKLYIFKRRYRS